MKNRGTYPVLVLIFLLGAAHAATITVNTADNTDFGVGKTNLYYALALANTNGAAANTINFAIPGPGPFYIKTPTNGYPLITNHDITINGYSQPGSSPNTNSIHAPNNAKIKIVLDSRIDPASADFLGTDMNYANGAANAGFGSGDVAILGLFRATNTTISGLCFLGQFSGNYDMYCVAVAGDEGGTSYNCHVAGCWFGVDVDGTSVVGNCVQAIAVARHRDPGNTYQITSDRFTFGVAAGSANPRAEFNVALGMIETLGIEDNGARISGNFLGVYPSGNRCWIGPIDGVSLGIGDNWRETHIEIGRANNNTVIGSDLDGVNDDQEGNVIGGVVDNVLWPLSPGYTGLRGYTHSIEFYGNNNTIAGTNYGPGSAIIANNYCGVGIDGVTRFTNGVPFSDGNPPTSRIEGNVIFNNYPTNIFDPSQAGTRGFYDGTPTVTSARKNTMVNNYPYPKNAGVAAYYQIYTKALATAPAAAADVEVVITNATTATFIGTFPIQNASYPTVTFDVYLADPEGLTNGLIAADPAEPNGWVQGRVFLGSPANLSATPGQFILNTAPLGIAATDVVTITANYSGTNGTLTSPFSAPVTPIFIPGSLASVGLTRAVPDVPIWYDGTGVGKVKVGPINLTNQLADHNTWEPWVSVLGQKTFLIECNKYADDSALANQRYVVAFQPAAAGTYANAKLGECFYADAGTPYTNAISSRQDGNPGRVEGDRRYDGVNIATGGEADPQDYGSVFNSDNRFDPTLPLYVNGPAGMRCGLIQAFSVNLSTFAQTPLCKAFDGNSLGHPEFAARTDASNQQRGRFGGGIASLDNGNFAAVIDDRSPFFPGGNAGNETISLVFQPNGTVVKSSFLVSAAEAWTDPCGFKGGFCVRSGANLYFYDNAGNAVAGPVDFNAASGVVQSQGRGDGDKIASDPRTPYVYYASAGWLTIWNSTNGAFLAKYQYRNQLDPALPGGVNRSDVACDALGNVCVAWDGKPDGTGFLNNQIMARVFHFDGSTVTPTTGTFWPFTSYDSDVNNLLGYVMENGNLDMTTRFICIAAKGLFNSTNNPVGGPDCAAQTTVYTVISNPGYVRPTLTATRSAGNVIISWPASGGDGTLQSTPTVSPTAWTDVSPQPATVLVNGDTYQKTVPVGAGNKYFRLSVQ